METQKFLCRKSRNRAPFFSLKKWSRQLVQLQMTTSVYASATIGTDKGHKGLFCLFLGRFGYIEEIMGGCPRILNKEWFATVVIDWRSQGLPNRWRKIPDRPYSSAFLITKKMSQQRSKLRKELDLPKPWYLLEFRWKPVIACGHVRGSTCCSAAFISPNVSA